MREITTKELIARLRMRLVRMAYVDSTDELIKQAADRLEQLEIDLAAMRGAANSYKAAMEKAEAERDAAIRDTKHADCCTVCIGSGVPEDDCTGDCPYCELLCRCRDCLDGSEYKWRGLAALRENPEPLTPCDLCGHNPPSSRDGKPCCMCPASAVMREGGQNDE